MNDRIIAVDSNLRSGPFVTVVKLAALAAGVGSISIFWSGG